MFASVIVDIESTGAPGALTYEVPPEMASQLSIGSYVRVPLGGRQALGYVVGFSAAYDGPTKPITNLVHPEPIFDAPLLDLAAWMADRYFCTLPETLRCLAPEGLATRLRTLVSLQNVPDPEAAAAALERRSPALASLVRLLAAGEPVDVAALRSQWPGDNLPAALRRLKARGWIREQCELASRPAHPKMVPAFRPARPAAELAAEAERRARKAPAQSRALALFAERGVHILGTEAAALGLSAGVLRSLAEEGLLAAERVPVRRDPWQARAPAAPPPALTPAQQQAVAIAREALDAGQHDVLLLHGVTGSGKTEVYLHAIAMALQRGRDAIVLLPEIALTAQVVEVFKGRFGDRVALLHSALSSGERYDEWHRLRSGEARIAVGARSALFAPCRHLGLLVVDEEHEPSYKQENTPRYHARHAAIERARAVDALVILGSATPSIESFFLADAGDYHLVSLPERVSTRPMPAVQVVDLRAGKKEMAPTIFSAPLLDGLSARLERGEQSILFVNRRGFASFVLCRDCGYTEHCPNCSVSLTLHAVDHSVRCHHCNYGRPAPTTCPKCQGDRIRPFGLGTERVEEEIRALFPQARVLRMDRDTTAGKDAHGRLYRAFRAGEADILIGTQMVAKGLDFPGVTLVGVVAADTGLNVPDFRAAERTFQLLTQVAGRSGRGERPGEAIVQTFNPDHYAIIAARDQDYAAFYAREVDFRRELGYPPFGAIVNVHSADSDPGMAQARAARAAAAIAEAARQKRSEVCILGPAPAPLARIKRRWRWHVVVRGPQDGEVQRLVHAGIASLPVADRDALAVDADPMAML